MTADAVADACLHRLRDSGQTLATAESLTAGLICATLASIPGASTVLRGGIAAYATDIKVGLLGVDHDLVASFGVVSAECAAAMAARARVLFGADWAVSATGVAGPDRQDGRDVGTVFIAVEGPSSSRVVERMLAGERNEIRAAAVSAALDLLARSLGLAAREETGPRRC